MTVTIPDYIVLKSKF